MSFETLKGVMIGAGRFARFQAEAWRRVEGAKIVAVADEAPGRAGEFSEQFGIARAYQDAAEMLERERPDFVDIVTRPDSHFEIVRLAASHGAAVICQKPMAPSWDECAAMVKVCADANVRLFIHENWRWQPWYREIKRLLDQGEVGKPFYAGFVMRNSDGRGAEPYAAQPYIRDMERLLVYEMVVHFIDTFRFLLGEFTGVFCRMGRVNQNVKGEDYTLIHLDFENGARGLIDANRISGPARREPISEVLIVEGDRGKIRLARDCRIWLDEYGDAEKPHDYAFPVEGYRGDSVLETQRHFISCFRTGERCESEGEDYLKTVAAVFACYDSVKTGQAVPLFRLRGTIKQ
ncbi:MAG: Gfo/Idh/MocA family oxidoreductase [Chloracidobacterium sp.]|nr:Gfo/Idh/MocA family oxidoreductase [Chloracidobacterium sp.]